MDPDKQWMSLTQIEILKKKKEPIRMFPEYISSFYQSLPTTSHHYGFDNYAKKQIIYTRRISLYPVLKHVKIKNLKIKMQEFGLFRRFFFDKLKQKVFLTYDTQEMATKAIEARFLYVNEKTKIHIAPSFKDRGIDTEIYSQIRENTVHRGMLPSAILFLSNPLCVQNVIKFLTSYSDIISFQSLLEDFDIKVNLPLKSVCISNSNDLLKTKINDDDFDTLIRCSEKIQKVEINNCPFNGLTSTGLERSLVRCKDSLTVLNLTGIICKTTTLRYLATELHNLSDLEIGESNAHIDKALNTIFVNNEKLKLFGIYNNCFFTGESLDSLKVIETLIVNHVPMLNANILMEVIQKLKHLSHLKLISCDAFNDRSIVAALIRREKVTGNVPLQTLSLDRTQLCSKLNLARFKVLRMDNVTYSSLELCLLELSSLQFLSASMTIWPTLSMMFQNTSNYLKHLLHLDISGCSNFGDEAFLSLAYMKLQTLKINYLSMIIGENLRFLLHLQELECSYCDSLIAKSIVSILKNSTLMKLNVTGCKRIKSHVVEIWKLRNKGLNIIY